MTTRLELLCAASTAGLRAAAFPVEEPLDLKRASGAGATGRPCSKAMTQSSAAPRSRRRRPPKGWGSRRRRSLRCATAISAAGRPRACRDRSPGAGRARALARRSASRPHGGELLRRGDDARGPWMDALPQNSAILAITPAAVLRAAIVHALAAGPRLCFPSMFPRLRAPE